VQVAVVNGDGVRIEPVVGFAAQIQIDTRAQAPEHILTTFERYARDLGVESGGIADVRVPFAILLDVGKRPLDERFDFVPVTLSLSKGGSAVPQR